MTDSILVPGQGHIPLNTAPPQETTPVVKWNDSTQIAFTLDMIEAMSEADFRLFTLVLVSGNVNDPRFVQRFKPEVTDAGA